MNKSTNLFFAAEFYSSQIMVDATLPFKQKTYPEQLSQPFLHRGTPLEDNYKTSFLEKFLPPPLLNISLPLAPCPGVTPPPSFNTE